MIFQYSKKNHAFIYILFFLYRFLFYLCAFQKRELKISQYGQYKNCRRED